MSVQNVSGSIGHAIEATLTCYSSWEKRKSLLVVEQLDLIHDTYQLPENVGLMYEVWRMMEKDMGLTT
jgi:hypothetical protein